MLVTLGIRGLNKEFTYLALTPSRSTNRELLGKPYDVSGVD